MHGPFWGRRDITPVFILFLGAKRTFSALPNHKYHFLFLLFFKKNHPKANPGAYGVKKAPQNELQGFRD